jgi:hypothetical protein
MAHRCWHFGNCLRLRSFATKYELYRYRSVTRVYIPEFPILDGMLGFPVQLRDDPLRLTKSSFRLGWC